MEAHLAAKGHGSEEEGLTVSLSAAPFSTAELNGLCIQGLTLVGPSVLCLWSRKPSGVDELSLFLPWYHVTWTYRLFFTVRLLKGRAKDEKNEDREIRVRRSFTS